jgi:peptidyl-prolyl cis-trans isomerase SurA
MDIRDRALQGEDFGDLAMKYSDDPSAKDLPATQSHPARKGNRGDLGFFTVFDMVYPFETAAYNTPVGSISMPVRTEYGYHLIKVTDKEPALGTVQVAHIYVAIPPNSTKRDSLQKKAKIFEAYKLLQSGDSFEDVVKKYSEDKGSIENGGKLPWFGSNRMVPEFIIQARELKDTGDYSQPFQTIFGWHIIKLLGRKPVGTFEEEKAALKSRLEKDQRIQLSKDAVIERIKDEYGIKEYPRARDAVYELLDSTLYKGEWDAQKADGMNKTVFSLGPKKYTQKQLADYLAQNQNKRITDKLAFFNDNYKKFVDDNCLEYENSKLEDKYPEFRNLVQEYHDGILLFDLTDQKVWSKAVKDTTGLREFFEQNPGKYMWGKRLSASIVTIHHPENISVDTLRSDFASGMAAEQVLSIFNNDSTQNISIETGKFPKGDNEVIDNIRWKTGLSPMTDSKEGPAFVFVYEILKPMPKTLDEARGLVTSDYQNYLEKQWIAQLREKYPVQVNEEVLKTLK